MRAYYAGWRRALGWSTKMMGSGEPWASGHRRQSHELQSHRPTRRADQICASDYRSGKYLNGPFLATLPYQGADLSLR